MNLSCIVCAIDSSDASPAVLASALALAEWECAELQIVHLVDRAEESILPSPVIRERSTTVVRGGDPAVAIIDRARSVRADLIVVGTRLAAAHPQPSGCCAEAIARDAHCPTLIVPFVTATGFTSGEDDQGEQLEARRKSRSPKVGVRRTA